MIRDIINTKGEQKVIKAYKELNEMERKAVHNYLHPKSWEEIKEELETKMYHYGEGVFFYFQENTVVASIKLVLEAVEHLSTAYIHYLSIQQGIENRVEIAKELIHVGIQLAEEKGSRTILFGVREEEILELVKTLGYIPSYHAYKMILTDRELHGEPLELVRLTEENKEEYLNVFNRSFCDMPHGCYYEMEEIDHYIEDCSQNGYYLVRDQTRIVGFLNTEITDQIGSFDIGVCKEYRGLGYGKRLLETAIDALNRAKVDKVTLTVIETNTRAFQMYQKRGFQIESILSHWIVIK